MTTNHNHGTPKITTEPLLTRVDIEQGVARLAEVIGGATCSEKTTLLTIAQRGRPVSGAMRHNLPTHQHSEMLCVPAMHSTELSVDFNGSSVGDVSGRHVVLLDAIYETGKTFLYASDVVLSWGAKSVSFVSLLEKRCEKQQPDLIVSTAFRIPDLSVVGWGLGYNGMYQDLKNIHLVTME